MYGEKRDAYRFSVGKPERRKPVGRRRHRWEDDIKMNVRVVGWVMDWIDLALNRDRWRAVVDAGMNIRVPLNTGNFLNK